MNKYTLNKKNRTLLCLLLIEIINSKVCPMTYPPHVNKTRKNKTSNMVWSRNTNRGDNQE